MSTFHGSPSGGTYVADCLCCCQTALTLSFSLETVVVVHPSKCCRTVDSMFDPNKAAITLKVA